MELPASAFKQKLVQDSASACAANGVGGERFRMLSGRARPAARLAAAIGNSAMIIYVYLAHLSSIEWHRFGTFRTVPEGQSTSLRDYIRLWELDPAFDHLRLFTFSEAMLENIGLYLFVGTPVALVLLALEFDRIQWLSCLVRETLRLEEAARAIRWLNGYMVTMTIMMTFILLVAPFHLGWPMMHYTCAGMALSFGSISMLLCLNAPLDLDTIAAAKGDDPEVAQWIHRVQHVERPVVKVVLGLHILALGAGVWKAEFLGDDRLALLFGMLETLLILGYQLFAGVFVLDDLMLSRKAIAPAAAASCKASMSAPGGKALEQEPPTPGTLESSKDQDRLLGS